MLAATKVVTLEVVVPSYGVNPDGTFKRVERLDMRTLSYHRWYEIGAMVLNPVVPETRIGPDGRRTANPYDVTYLQQVELAELKRNAMRLADAVEGAGTPLPGVTLEEKATWLAENTDAGVMKLAIDWLRAASEKGVARIVQRAESFQPVSVPGDADVPAERLDAGDVAGTP